MDLKEMKSEMKDAAATIALERSKELIDIAISVMAEKIKQGIVNFPDNAMQFLKKEEVEEEVLEKWSEKLFNEGIICKGYKGLSDELLIHNFHQEGYLDGLFTGCLLTLANTTDQCIPKEEAGKVFAETIPLMLGNSYEDRQKLISECKKKLNIK